jgi:hypothetical protein
VSGTDRSTGDGAAPASVAENRTAAGSGSPLRVARRHYDRLPRAAGLKGGRPVPEPGNGGGTVRTDQPRKAPSRRPFRSAKARGPKSPRRAPGERPLQRTARTALAGHPPTLASSRGGERDKRPWSALRRDRELKDKTVERLQARQGTQRQDRGAPSGATGNSRTRPGAPVRRDRDEDGRRRWLGRISVARTGSHALSSAFPAKTGTQYPPTAQARPRRWLLDSRPRRNDNKRDGPT